jgi:hypothetical protein
LEKNVKIFQRNSPIASAKFYVGNDGKSSGNFPEITEKVLYKGKRISRLCQKIAKYLTRPAPANTVVLRSFTRRAEQSLTTSGLSWKDWVVCDRGYFGTDNVPPPLPEKANKRKA